MENLVVRELTLHRLQEVSAAWQEHAGVDAFQSELQIPILHLFEDLVRAEVPQTGPSIRQEYVEVCGPKNESYAIVDIADSELGKVSKILKFYLSPALWNPENSEKVKQDIADVHVAAYTQILENKITSGMKEIKVYGREDSRLQMLIAIQNNWDTISTGFEASVQGRWLSIKAVEGDQ